MPFVLILVFEELVQECQKANIPIKYRQQLVGDGGMNGGCMSEG